ncbi:hypothetical protein GCM10022224_064890 [Nonomuraea antimicrobica]|uniref:Uncharacterized protein n=1 Tax=Nonomuraea antimicrobica TaxID=561173 RepID=A0ABP7CH62_9ACTN
MTTKIRLLLGLVRLPAAVLRGRRASAGRAAGAPEPGAVRLPLSGQERATWQERRVIRAVDWAVAALALTGVGMTARRERRPAAQLGARPRPDSSAARSSPPARWRRCRAGA